MAIIADAVSLKTQRHPLANPVLHSIWIVALFLLLTGTSYSTYFAGAQFVHFLLGPATVALAVPLYENRKRVAASILPMLVALVVGSITAIVSVMVLASTFGLPRPVILSLAPHLNWRVIYHLGGWSPIAVGLAMTANNLGLIHMQMRDLWPVVHSLVTWGDRHRQKNGREYRHARWAARAVQP